MPKVGMNLIIIGYQENDQFKLICREFENYEEMSECLKIDKTVCYRIVSKKQSHKNIIYEVIDTLGKEERERQRMEWILSHQ